MLALCKHCRFGKPVFDTNQQEEAVECHRHAPRPVIEELKTTCVILRWPLMYPDDFCGDFGLKNCGTWKKSTTTSN